jgi:hypothetical protein
MSWGGVAGEALIMTSAKNTTARSRAYSRFRALGRAAALASGAWCAAFDPGPALAQHGQESALAEALFRKGVDDMKAGRFETGCPAIEESHRLDPRPGALFTLAECDAKWGKLATAVVEYEDFLRVVARQPAEKRPNYKDRVDEARRQKEALAPRVPKLTVDVAGGLPPGAKVTCDGVPLGPGALGLALPLNPGEHELALQRADGGVTVRRAVRLEPGETKRVELPAPPPAPPRAAPPADGRGASAGSTPRTLGFVAGGVGIAGLAVGGIAGALALSNGGDAKRECPGRLCTEQGYAALERAKDQALVANIGLGVGVAALVAGGVLLLTADAPRRAPAAASALRPAFGAGPGGGWFGLDARFLAGGRRAGRRGRIRRRAIFRALAYPPAGGPPRGRPARPALSPLRRPLRQGKRGAPWL